MKRADGLYLSAVPLDFSTIEQSLLNIENKLRSNLLPWTGQFSPQLVEVLLAEYASDDSLVLDPFAGSGTILCECGRRGLQAYAIEINPAAYSMARTYQLMNRQPHDRWQAILKVAHALRDGFSDVPPCSRLAQPKKLSRCEKPSSRHSLFSTIQTQLRSWKR